MLNRIFSALLFAALPLAPVPAAARQCEAVREVIVDLNPPDVGSYNIWDAVYGEREHTEFFVSGLAREDGNVVVAGERHKSGGDAGTALMLVELDRRGRPVLEKFHDVEGLRQVVKILEADGGYAVMGHKKSGRRGQAVWLGFFGADGALKREVVIAAGGRVLTGYDLAPSLDGQGLVLVTAEQSAAGEKPVHARLYFLNGKGRVVSDRAYEPGLENRLYSLTPEGRDFYIATGYMTGEDGRRTGWVVKLNRDGGIVWEKQYPRGFSAVLHDSRFYLGRYIVAVGDAKPAGRGGPAAWVMLLDAVTGDIGWQRYYRTEGYDMRGRGLLVRGDGLITVMMQAEQAKARAKGPARAAARAVTAGPVREDTDYVRLFTMTPRGVGLLSEAYYNGAGAWASDLFFGAGGAPVMVGASEIAYNLAELQDPPEKQAAEAAIAAGGNEEPAVAYSRDGWVVTGAAGDAYEDPCIDPYRFLP